MKHKSYLLWAFLFLCLLPFVILSFFNFLAFDDYTAIDAFDRFGFFEMQRRIYFGWEGRFTATFIAAVFEMSGIIRDHYWLVFPIFAFFSCAAIFFLLHSINTYCLKRTFSRASLVQASLVLYILDLYVKVEMSSGSYWFSPTAVYQTAVILFLFLSGCLIRRFVARDRDASTVRLRTGRLDVLIILLSILLCGCNELAAISLACFFLLLVLAHRYYGRPVPRVLFLYLGVVLLTGLFILLTSGVLSHRESAMKGHAGSAGVFLILLYRAGAVFYYVLKDPLFWVCTGVCFLLGLRVSLLSVSSSFIALLKSRRFFIPGIAAIVLLVLFTLAPILVVTAGSIPERALNNMTSLASFCLLALSFLLGVSQPSLGQTLLPVKSLSTLAVFLLGSALLANYNYKEAWKSVITGYFYHSIQSDRQQVFMDAREHHQHVVTIPSYEAALDEKVRKVFPHGAPMTLQLLLEERPTLLYYDNEAENPAGQYLLRYYQLDSILVKGRPK